MTRILLNANTDWYLYNFRLSLAKCLRDCGHEVILVSPPGRFAGLLEQAGFRWIGWNVGRQTLAPWTETVALANLTGIYRQERPALVHHFTIKPVLYGSLIARILKIPAVVNSVTGLGYVFLRQELKARLIRQMARLQYRMAFSHPNCAAIFENDTDRQYFIRTGLVASKQSRLIEGVGIDPGLFTPAPEPGGIPVIVLPARMLWDKGVGTLVEAARLMRPRCQARIALVGEPDSGNPASIEEETLNEWRQQGIIEWWGWRENMPAVYQEAHIVTLPSSGEGVPTVLLEAAACGKPLVATDVPGCRDVVADGVNGLLVPPGDPAALAEALEKLIRQPELRKKMGEAGRQLILEKYTSQRVNAATLAVYGQILPEIFSDGPASARTAGKN